MAAMSVLAVASPALRTLLGLPLVFYLPGYAILRAAFREPRFGLAGTIFAVGLSIAMTIFCGLVLHLLGALTPEGWAIVLAVAVWAACGAAFLRSRPAKRRPVRRAPLAAVQATMLICAVLIAIGTIVLARQWASAHPQFAYTEFWMVPHVSGGGVVTIGVKNAERARSTYDLELLFDDQTVAVRRSIQLGVGETWHSDFALPMGIGAANAAEARLFRAEDNHLVYRRVWLKTAPES